MEHRWYNEQKNGSWIAGKGSDSVSQVEETDILPYKARLITGGFLNEVI